MTNKVIVLYRRPVGIPVSADFKFNLEEVPVADDGEILLLGFAVFLIVGQY
jgi:NADPH-dependent curcumin reductase CurA